MEGNDFSKVTWQYLLLFFLHKGFLNEKEWNVSLGSYECKSIVSHAIHLSNIFIVSQSEGKDYCF